MDRRTFIKSTAAAVALAALPLPALAKKQLRSTEVYDKGVWKPGAFAQLQKDDIFRLRDPDGTLVDEGTEHEISLALSDAVVSEVGFFQVESQPFTNITMDTPNADRLRVVKDGKQREFVQHVNLRTHWATMTYIPPGGKAFVGSTAGIGPCDAHDMTILFQEQLLPSDYVDFVEMVPKALCRNSTQND